MSVQLFAENSIEDLHIKRITNKLNICIKNGRSLYKEYKITKNGYLRFSIEQLSKTITIERKK